MLPTRCPRCPEPLQDDACARHGRLVPEEELPQRMGKEASVVLLRALHDAPLGALSCPGCGHRFRAAKVLGKGGEVEVDGCRSCRLVWFDADEMERLRTAEERRDDRAFPMEAAIELLGHVIMGAVEAF